MKMTLMRCTLATLATYVMVLGLSVSQSQAIELKEIVRFNVDAGSDPNNAGFYRPITVIAPPGSTLIPRR